MTRPLRIVLQTGATSLTAALLAVAFTYGTVLATFLVLVVGFEDAPYHRILLPLVPVIFTGGTIVLHVWAWRSRASDLILDDDAGVRVEGGRAAGRAWAWSEIDVLRSRLIHDPNARVTINGHDTFRRGFVLGLADGGEVEIASSFDDVEQGSFATLLATLRARALPAPVAAAPVGLLRCPSCGAPVSPRADAVSSCWRCGSAVPTPAEVQAKVRAGEALAGRRAAVEERVRAWVDQPSAADVNRWLAALFAVRYALPLLLCLGSGQWMAILAGAWTLGKVASLRIVDRFAYRSLVLDWAARPPVAVGAPPRCRSCQGPLSPRAGEVVTRCPACDADNVLGLDVEAAAGALTVAHRDIESFIAEQAERRREPMWIAVGGGVLTGGLFFWAALGA